MFRHRALAACIRWLSAILVLLSGSALAIESELRFQGMAYSIETQELLYTERYEVSFDRHGKYVKSTVEYLNPDGEMFAIKMMDYQRSQSAPDVFFRDLRSHTAVKIEAFPTEVSIIYLDRLLGLPANTVQNTVQFDTKHVEKEHREGKKSIISLNTDAPLVVDAGFDRFVQHNWSSLAKGKTLSFSFLVISRAKLFDFEIARTNVQDNSRSLEFEVKPGNFFFSMLVDPIRLVYDLETRRLLRFEGLTNIERFVDKAPQGDNFVARIQYDYF